MIGAYTIKAVILSFLFWLFDAALHKFVFFDGELNLWPQDPDELWMRAMIVFLLISFGLYADHNTKVMLEKELAKEKEKCDIFNATVSSTQHILNNLLNHMMMFQMEAERTAAFDEEVKALFEQSMREGKELVEKLSAVEDITEQNIKVSVYPQKKD